MKQLLIQPQRMFIVYFMLTVIHLLPCRHLYNDSVRLFNKPTPSSQAIATFPASRKSHFHEQHS